MGVHQFSDAEKFCKLRFREKSSGLSGPEKALSLTSMTESLSEDSGTKGPGRLIMRGQGLEVEIWIMVRIRLRSW